MLMIYICIRKVYDVVWECMEEDHFLKWYGVELALQYIILCFVIIGMLLVWSVCVCVVLVVLGFS